MHRIIFVLTALLFISVPAISQEKVSLPSQALESFNKEFSQARKNLPNPASMTSDEWNELRKSIALNHIKQYDLTRLPADEKNKFAMLLWNADKKAESMAIYEGVAEGDDFSAREAAKFILSERIKDESIPLETLREELDKFRKRFPPTRKDIFGISQHVAIVSSRAYKEGKKQLALEIFLDQYKNLGKDSPYGEWWYYDSIVDYYKAIGQVEKALNLLRQKSEEFREISKMRAGLQPQNAENIETYEKETKRFSQMADAFERAVKEVELVGQQAPDINFTHYFNTDPIDFDKLKGQVVVLDFWATWCAPCINTFDEMRDFHAKYSSKGVVVIGVTGFQGSMSNHGASEVDKISEEEELKLMKQFLQYNNVTWPIAFSDRGCYDEEYASNSIPKIVIIDKNGKIRLISHPQQKEEIVSLVETLLKE